VLDVAKSLGLSVEGVLAGGEHGAVGVRSSNGERMVLKVFDAASASRLQRSIDMVSVVHDRGVRVPWPYSTGVAAGHAYTLQPRCRGSVPVVLTERHVETMLNWWTLQYDAPVDDDGWCVAVGRALTVGDATLCAEHDSIKDAGGDAAALLNEILASGPFDLSDVRSTDVVHGDWHHRNLLADGDVVTAIIDWEASRPGDARFDLCYLAYWAEVFDHSEVSPRAAARIKSTVRSRVDASVRSALSALIAIHQLWFVSAHRPERLPETARHVEQFLAPHWR